MKKSIDQIIKEYGNGKMVDSRGNVRMIFKDGKMPSVTEQEAAEEL